MLKHVAVAATFLLLSAPVVTAQNTPAPKPAQPTPATEKTATLTIGDKAPPVSVEKWVKGEPITGFEKGKIYVVEFWATWCGPCIQSMPHISELQKQYKDKGVTIIGTNIWEDKAFNADTYAKVEKFVKDSKDMNYTVAYDGAAKAMDKSYMQAAGANGIPRAFIVNQDGKIAYIGHPMKLDEPLKEIVAGTYDIKAAADKYKKEQAAAAASARTQSESAGFSSKYKSLLKTDPTKAYELANKAMDSFAKDDSQLLNEIAWSIVDPEAKVAKKDLDLAMKAALRADELSNGKNAAIIDTVARVYFCKGDTAKALELQKKAVSIAPASDKANLEPALKEYEAAAKNKK